MTLRSQSSRSGHGAETRDCTRYSLETQWTVDKTDVRCSLLFPRCFVDLKMIRRRAVRANRPQVLNLEWDSCIFVLPTTKINTTGPSKSCIFMRWRNTRS